MIYLFCSLSQNIKIPQSAFHQLQTLLIRKKNRFFQVINLVNNGFVKVWEQVFCGGNKQDYQFFSSNKRRLFIDKKVSMNWKKDKSEITLDNNCNNFSFPRNFFLSYWIRKFPLCLSKYKISFSSLMVLKIYWRYT